MKILTLALSLILTHTALHAGNGDNNKDGGNGQLVVIPKNHKAPVPYEVAVAWETGKYRNFFKMPCMKGVNEPRQEFNRNYACHALPWLEIIKDLSPVLYKGLINVAEKTHFNIVNNYILWKEKPYPNGELDYKKYEKAAYFNGEIIFSTLVMDRIGPLKNKSNVTILTKEQNQGYIVVHELINALYPEEDVAWKLNLGEVILQKVLFNQNKAEALLHLALIDLEYLREEKDSELLLDVLEELKKIRPNYERMNTVNDKIFYIENYLQTGLSFKDAFEAYLDKQQINSFTDYAIYHKEFIQKTIGYYASEEEIDFQFLIKMSTKYNFELYNYKLISLNSKQSEELKSYLSNMRFEIYTKALNLHKLKLVNQTNSEFSQEYMRKYYDLKRLEARGIGKDEVLDHVISIVYKNTNTSEINKYINYSFGSFSRSDLEYSLRLQDKVGLVNLYVILIQEEFYRRKFDFAKTNLFLEWIYSNKTRDDDDRILVAPPLTIGDQAYFVKTNKLYTLSKVSKNRKEHFSLKFSDGDKFKIDDLYYDLKNYEAIILMNKGN